MEETFFVKINEPNTLRITLLESSKLILHTIRIEKKLEDIRKRKISEINNLKTQAKELEFLLSRLEELLPHQELLKNEVQKIKKSLKTVSQKKGKKTKTNPQEELVKLSKKIDASQETDKISLALSEIEKKIRALQ